jgi:hypothetical protein
MTAHKTARNVSGKLAKVDFCSTFGVSEAQLERYFQQGMGHEKKGRRIFVPMPAGRVWLHAYLIEKGKKSAAPTTINDARLRKETAQAALEELKLAREQAVTMRVEDGERLLGEAYSRVRAKLQNLSPRIAGAAFGAATIQECQAKVEPLVAEVMEELCTAEDVPGDGDGDADELIEDDAG